MMEPFDDSFYLDTVRVCPPASGVDIDGAPDLNPGPPGPPLRCAVQHAIGSGNPTMYENVQTPYGITKYNVLFPDFPGVTQAQQLIIWGDTEMMSHGQAENPGFGQPWWTVSASSST